mmetsp:Transcript_5785/g.22592  ORF Transcript_5785/g.22592 Transcript_5785/m.22592 type:complete len:555 (-) Transcript_5785:148-1812(-)
MAALEVTLLDYGAGNVRSVENAIKECGYTLKRVQTAEDISKAKALIFPGVGAFGCAMDALAQQGFTETLREYLRADRPFLGICLGMQTLFEGSDEALGLPGLGIIPGHVERFDAEQLQQSVPHIGWNGVKVHKDTCLTECLSREGTQVYFVHSFRVPVIEANRPYVLCTTNYGNEEFISAVQYGNIVATQFHPEKSSATGLRIFKSFLDRVASGEAIGTERALAVPDAPTQLSRRVIACLDVRTNDEGDLVVTKGDQYKVRETSEEKGKGEVRNLGKPVDLAQRYYEEGADEITFLNITSFREGVLQDMPMLQVLQHASARTFVPLTVGGGIREYTDRRTHITWSALDVAATYFRAGADKVSIGSDAVYAAERYFSSGNTVDGESSIEQIALVYGSQAVVVSIDPRRAYVPSAEDAPPGTTVLEVKDLKTGAMRLCWYQCTVKGGREGRQIDAIQLAKASEALGAGEILLNCVDMDGQGQGFDHALVDAVARAVHIPVIASSGAGAAEHFSNVFSATRCDAALAAGIFHRHEVAINDVKKHVRDSGVPCRVLED